MAVIVQTAPATFSFDGTPDRGFIDLGPGSEFRIATTNEARRFVIGLLSVNATGPGVIQQVRIVLALSKGDADSIDHFALDPVDTNQSTEWTLRGPILVPLGYSIFVYTVGAGSPGACRLLLAGGVVSQLEGFTF